MDFNGSMFNASALESTGSAVVDDDQNGELGEIADARTKTGNEETGATGDTELTDEQKEEARLLAEKANEGKTAEEIETERLAAEAETNKDKTPEQLAAEKKEADDKAASDKEAEKAALRAEARKEYLAELGVKSEEELKEKLAGPKKVLTPEEQAEADEQYNTGLLTYASKNKLFNTDDFAALKNIKAVPDVELAYADFAAEYKALNKDRKGDDGAANPVTDDESREAFDQLYHIGSEDESLKKIGANQIKRIADGKRGELETKYNNAKESFDDWSHKDKNSKPFISFINQTVKSAIPEKLEFDGPDGAKLSYKLDKVDQKEIEKLFINNTAFDDYLENGSSQAAKDQITKTVDAYLFYKHKDDIIKTVRDTSYEAGVKKGSVGAVAPFIKETKQTVESTGDKQLSADEKAKLRQSFGNTFGRV